MKTHLLSAIKRLVNGNRSLVLPVNDDSIKAEPTSSTGINLNVATSGSSLHAEVKAQFDRLARRIAKKETFTPEELIPYLCLELVNDRVYVNYHLGCAFHYAGDNEQAKVFIERAWNLSGFDQSIFISYKTIQLAVGNVEAVRESHKRAGLLAATNNDFASALEHFDQAHFAHGFYDHVDKWQYDYDIMNALNSIAAKHHVPPRVGTRGKKLKVGYLLRGATEVNSILIRHVLSIVQHHNKNDFEIVCFALESQSTINSSPQGASIIEKLTQMGITFCAAPDSATDRLEALLAVARQIREKEIDILVACAGLVDYSHYFLCALRPSPVVLGFVQGPPAQFAPPMLDWCISWSKHPLMDTPVNCSLISWKGSDVLAISNTLSRADFDLPADACVILSGGRIEKFQNIDHWIAVKEILNKHPDAYYLVSGASETDVPFVRNLFGDILMHRLHLLGWRTDFAAIVRLADIVLDTYPNGGGQTLVESMEAEVPIVAHRNDFMKVFDQINWSPVEDFIDDDELLVERGDFKRLQDVLSRLIENKDLRKTLGRKCSEALLRSNTAQAVAACEQLYRGLTQKPGRSRSRP